MSPENTWVVDAALWSGVVALLAVAMWLSRPRPRSWQPARLYALGLDILAGRAVDDAVHHPRARVGVACTDDALRRWHAGDPSAVAVSQAVGRRAATVLWWGAPNLPLPDPARMPGWETVELGTTASPEMEARLEALLADRARRFVVLVSSDAATFFPFFADVPGLRDRVRAVVLVGADLGPAAEWLADNFVHERLDLEMDRAVPYLTLRTAPGQVLRTPPPEPSGRESIEVIDLGDTTALDADAGAALLLTLAALA